ncbi:uncharacterized protein FOMMEDRAFT_32038 [Fomitiporia mediterranea MF3/22]|uniref:uncharacterized protein n=1 Tax=Fomitiporia mediterranea (strain MF3/22) TaxID=694068 RepID=UPI0004409833|nr:uncharacterized protein FOMMEDRAFT_32038 [Fomitiporia mediterranea MF3/22]EJC98302.1 hypothetical protein FOMMEDRAFT_32038 [Fomitiporia mediterranea MF3/22]
MKLKALLIDDSGDGRGARSSTRTTGRAMRRGGRGTLHNVKNKKHTTSGKGTGANNDKSKTKHGSGDNSLQINTTTNNTDSMANRRMTRSMARSLESQEVDVKETSLIILDFSKIFFGSKYANGTEFELQTGVPFPPFPTTDEVPHLQVVEALGGGATGDVYRAELQHPNRPDLPCRKTTETVVKICITNMSIIAYYNWANAMTNSRIS